MPRVRYCLLCNDIRLELNGKFSIIGVFESWAVPNLSAQLPRFCVIAELIFEQPGNHRVAMRIDGPSGFRSELPGSAEANAPNPITEAYHATLVAEFLTFQPSGPGRYDIKFVVEQEELWGSAFLLYELTPP